MNLSLILNEQGNQLRKVRYVLHCGQYQGAINLEKSRTENDSQQFDAKDIQDYQKSGIDHWTAILKYHGFKIEQGTMILDHGADVSGRPLHYLVSKTGSRAVGYNIFRFHKQNQIQSFVSTHENVSMVLGKIGSPLPFEQESFNIVVSINVLHHVSDFKMYLRESVRVLKNKGALFLSWNPQYYEAFGHQVHGDMVKGWWETYKCINNNNNYNNISNSNYNSTQIIDWNYQWVGKWDHFLKTPERLREELMQGPLGSCQEVVDELVQYVYDKNDLNQVAFEDVLRYFRRLPDVDILTVEFGTQETSEEVEEKLTRKLGEHEFGVGSIWVLARKR